ncbi:hypothetical protein GGD50_005004 [Rhizobium paranaense]|uniref:Uncharacterized protein n=1 Tax=Rhizobium paranaense TaxID=1650438 RepID=A0A7W8XVJ9_9HYPH|nr:hypothetical protein [Rhizobium paranaense]
MQNENSPRAAAERKAPRRGLQQAGRIGRAKMKRGASFCRLQWDCCQLGKTLERDSVDTSTPAGTNNPYPIARRYRTTPTHGFRGFVRHADIKGKSRR